MVETSQNLIAWKTAKTDANKAIKHDQSKGDQKKVFGIVNSLMHKKNNFLAKWKILSPPEIQ